MEYKFAVEQRNYEDFASGAVLYNQAGATSFPVRLGSEIFQRCMQHLATKGIDGPYTVYDPCCGGAYLLTVLGFLHRREIGVLLASDIDERVLELAARNLSLLTPAGLSERKQKIREMAEQYGKESHKRALQSAENLMALLKDRGEEDSGYDKGIEFKCFRADAAASRELEAYKGKVHIVITDLPYGDLVRWGGEQEPQKALEILLTNLLELLAPQGIAAVVTKKRTAVSHSGFRRVERINAGKRQIMLLEPVHKK